MSKSFANFWKTKTDRNLFDNIAKKLNITNNREWGIVRNKEVINLGGGSALSRYGTLFNTLSFIYPDKEWKHEWFVKPSRERGYWEIKSNQRLFLENLSKKLNIKTPNEWGKVTFLKVVENGGNSVLKKYGGSLKEALVSIYPDISWQDNWFENIPKYSSGYWKNKQNQRKFFDNLEKELNIKHPSDWGKITINTIKQKEGKSLLVHFKGSLYEALLSIYPEINWNRRWFPYLPSAIKGFWREKQNQRKYLDSLKETLNIRFPQDWGNITRLDLKHHGASSLINHYYSSLYHALCSIYPETEWKREWFFNSPHYSHGYWRKKENHRLFLERVAKVLNIKKAEEWGNVRLERIRKMIGGPSMLSYHKGSLFKALQYSFPETSWKREWFSNLTIFPRDHWNLRANQRMFLEEIAAQYNVRFDSPSDWKRITLSLIRKKGGKTLLNMYGNSLSRIFNELCSTNLSSKKGSEISESQHFTFQCIKDIFPYCEILQNYRHPDLKSISSSIGVQLDIWIPQYKIGFEYHGEQHFRSLFNQSMSNQSARDQNRREMCKQKGITLIEIPYWWDLKKGSLIARILQLRPDLQKEISIRY